MPDRLHDTLTALRTDVDRAPLADSASVRARGNRRTRNQAIGSTVAAVAVLAGVVGVAGGLAGSDRAEAPPAQDGPTATTQVEPLRDLAADPFLAEGSPELTIGQVSFLRSPELPDPAQKPMLCMPDPATLGAEQSEVALFYTDLDPTFIEHVLRFGSVAAATDAAASLEQSFRDCPPGDPAEVETTDRGPDQVSDTAFRGSRLSVPTADAGIGYYEVGVARDANVVVVLQLNSMGNPAGEGAQDWLWDEERLAAALERAVD